MKKSIIFLFIFIMFSTLHAGWWKKFKKSVKRQWKKEWKKSTGNTGLTSRGNFWGVLSAKANDTMSAKYGIYREPAANARVRTIGQRLAGETRKNINYRFGILNTSLVNAFAFPDGQIYVTKGLLDMVRSDDELAGVLGHECAHVRNRDSQKALLKNLFFLSAMQAVLGKSKASKYKWLTLVQGLTMLKFSRKDEYEADYTGMEYAYAAGYDPAGMTGFLSKLRQREGRSSGLERNMLKFLSTHPLTADRIRRTASIAKILRRRGR